MEENTYPKATVYKELNIKIEGQDSKLIKLYYFLIGPIWRHEILLILKQIS